MAESIVRLKVESSEYDSKLKRASEGLTRYIEGCRKVGGTLEVVEADTLKYVQALGQMETKSTTAKGRLNEMTKAFTDLSVQFNHLTSEEKSSQFGQAMSASLEQLKARIIETKQELNTIGQSIGDAGMSEVKTGAAGVISTMGSMSMALQGVYNGMSVMSGAVSELTEAYGVQEQAELKLETVMRQRMNASNADIQSIKNLAAEQQRIGVIGDEVQLAGAQQVATFLSQKKSIEELLPAMNNLAVQRQGLNVTSEEMVSIGNMVGKVMQGNVGALSRVGITYDDAQAKAIKFGTEEQRAAALAEVINNNVGQMNRTLAQTDAGKAKQMANNFGDVQEEIGKVLARWEPFLKSFSQIGMIAMGVGQVANAVVGMTRAIISLTASQTIANLNTRMATSIVNGLSVAFTGSALAADTANVAIKGVTWTLRALEVATGIGIAIATISTAVELLGDKMSNTSGDAEELSSSLNHTASAADAAAARQQAAAERQRTAQNSVGQAVGDLTSKYETLRTEWRALKNDHERNTWIKKNQSAFGELGMSVENVNDAYNYFVKNSSRVVEALKAIAEADAYKDLYKESIKKREQASRNGTVANGAYHTVHKAGEKHNYNEYGELQNLFGTHDLENSGYVTVSTDWAGRKTLNLTQKGANLWTNKEASAASQRHSDYMQPFYDDESYYGTQMTQKQDRAARLSSAAGINMSGNGGGRELGNGGGTSRGGGGRRGGTTRGGGGTTHTAPTPKSEYDQNSDAIKKYTDQYVKLQQERENALNSGDTQKAAQIEGQSRALQIEVAALKQRNEQLKKWKDEADGNTDDIADPNSLKGLNEQLAELKKNQDLSTTHEQWQKWQNDIDGVQKKINDINGKSAKKDFSSLTSSNISGFISDLQQQLGQVTVGGLDYSKLLDKEAFATAFQNLLKEGLQDGADYTDIDAEGLWQKILTGDDPEGVKTALSFMLGQINDARGFKGLGDMSLDKSGGLQEMEKPDEQDWKRSVTEKADRAIGAMSQLTGGLKSMGIKIPDGVTKLINFGQGLIQVIQSVQALISIFSTSTVAMQTSSIGLNTAALIANTSALGANSIANFIPFARGGIVRAAGGHMFGGNSFSGDLIPAAVNSGELILNRAQQGNVASQLEGMGTLNNLELSTEVNGETLRFVLNANGRRTGRGEMVTSNIKLW